MPRPPLSLAMVGVPADAALPFWNQPNITCVVVSQSPPRVAHEGDVVSLTEAVRRAIKKEGVYQGPTYWKYEGQFLAECRERFELHCQHPPPAY